MLLDSHVLLWWATDSPKLPQWVRASIVSEQHQKLVSAASLWELEIKRAGGRLRGPSDLAGRVRNAGFTELPIGFREAVAAAALPRHHLDPFDRMLIAHARLDGLTLVSADRTMARYDVELLAPDWEG